MERFQIELMASTAERLEQSAAAILAEGYNADLTPEQDRRNREMHGQALALRDLLRAELAKLPKPAPRPVKPKPRPVALRLVEAGPVTVG